MTYEIPAKTDEDYDVVGLPRDENKHFWIKEDEFNYQYSRILNIFIVISGLIFSTQHFFFFSKGVNIYTYVIVSCIHALITIYFIFYFFQMIYTLNCYFVAVLIFFRKKFNYISKQLEHFPRESAKFNNRELSRLIYDFNYVYLELINLNNYFKKLSGVNLMHFFLSITCAIFIFLLNENVSIQIMGFTMCFFMNVAVLFFPSQYSNFVKREVSFF